MAKRKGKEGLQRKENRVQREGEKGMKGQIK